MRGIAGFFGLVWFFVTAIVVFRSEFNPTTTVEYVVHFSVVTLFATTAFLMFYFGSGRG